MINFYERMLPDPAGIKPTTSYHQSDVHPTEPLRPTAVLKPESEKHHVKEMGTGEVTDSLFVLFFLSTLKGKNLHPLGDTKSREKKKKKKWYLSFNDSS